MAVKKQTHVFSEVAILKEKRAPGFVPSNAKTMKYCALCLRMKPAVRVHQCAWRKDLLNVLLIVLLLARKMKYNALEELARRHHVLKKVKITKAMSVPATVQLHAKPTRSSVQAPYYLMDAEEQMFADQKPRM